MKNLPASAGDSGDTRSVTESGRSHEEASSNPRPCSCLENSMDRGAWWAIVHGVTKQLDIIEHVSLGVKVGDGKGKTVKDR